MVVKEVTAPFRSGCGVELDWCVCLAGGELWWKGQIDDGDQ